MSEPAPSPPSEPQAEPVEPAPAATPTRLNLLPWLSAIGFVILAFGLLWIWRNPATAPSATPEIDALTRQVAALQSQVTSLEQRPAPASPDLSSLGARLTALEQRPAAVSSPPVDLSPLATRITALEQRQTPDLGPLDARITSLESRDQAAQSDFNRRLGADEARLAALEKTAGKATQIQAARIALDAGLKLGTLPGAPPALARFAETDPPTEAQLRLSFPRAADAALVASRPNIDNKPLLARIWARAQDLVTIRQGDHVIVGDPAAGVLARAREALDAGDLAGAVAVTTTLSGPAAQPMAGWLAQARALLEARAALATWAAQG